MSGVCEAGPYLVSRGLEWARASLADEIQQCERCHGLGMLPVSTVDNGRSYDTLVECPKKRLSRRVALYNAAKIPAVHANSTLESYRPASPEQARALELTREFCVRWPQARPVVISGPVGTGKTHLLAAALRFATLEHGVSAAYVEISLLYATIRRGFQAGKSGGEIIEPLSKVDVLAIDELGKGRGSQFELETLDELVARRYNSEKPTLFATNYSLRAPEFRNSSAEYVSSADLRDSAQPSRYLSDRIGDRMYSRLCGTSEFVEFSPHSPDARRARLSGPGTEVSGVARSSPPSPKQPVPPSNQRK